MTAETIQTCYLDDYMIFKIPVEKYPNLCSGVYCWDYSSVNVCGTCDKTFCTQHTTDHMCFKEKSIVISPVSSEIKMDSIMDVVL